MEVATQPFSTKKGQPVTHRNAPLTVEGRRRLIERCRSRAIAHVAAEMGISLQCAAKWVNRSARTERSRQNRRRDVDSEEGASVLQDRYAIET